MFDKIMKQLQEMIIKMKKNDSGSAFIFVVIGVMFVSMVGATVMSVATNYVTTAIVDHYSTDNFYQTEGILAEIRSGIEEIAGAANEKAYLEVLDAYSSPKMTGKMKTVFARKYLTGIVRSLNGASTPTSTSQEVLDLESTKTTGWQNLKIDKIKAGTTDPGNVGSIYGGNDLQYRFEYDADTKEMYLVIRGLKINHTDNEYHTNLQTDIRIGVPDYSFEGDNTFEELKNYFSISDNIMKVANGAVESSTSPVPSIYGNIYSGTAKTPDNTVNDDKESGIEIHPNAKIEFRSNKIISRGNLNVFTGADVKMFGSRGQNDLGDLWVKNIVLRKTAVSITPAPSATPMTSKADIRDNAFVLDDLSIEDDNAAVNIGGNYYGYSYNRDNTTTPAGASPIPSLRSDYSSAILINGKNTTLKSDSLTKLILAGRTFVERKTFGSDLDMTDDIMMGESFAVKSNQIAYLVPEEFIVEGHNPLVFSEIADVADVKSKVNINALKDFELGNGKKIGEFLKEGDEITANYNNSGQYVFLYLNFKDEVAANEYFSCYYNQKENNTKVNMQYLNDKAQAYISTVDGNMKIAPALYLIAGNIIHNYYSQNEDGVEQEEANYFENDRKPIVDLLKDGQSKMAKYLALQMTLTSTHNTSDVRGELENDSKKELVKDKILNIKSGVFEKDGEVLDGDLSKAVPGYDDWMFVCQNNDYMIDVSAPNKGIILCAGDVKVIKPFEGLIIASGKVSIEGGTSSYKANPAVAGEILEMIKNRKDLGWWKYFRCLDDKKKNSVNVAECISYQNWERNSD